MPLKHLFLVLLVCLTWAFNFLAGKYGADYFGPFLGTALRFGFVFLFLFPFVVKVKREEIVPFMTVGFVMGILHFGLVFAGFYLAGDVSSLAILAQLHIPFVVLLGVLFLGERIGIWQSSGIAIAFLGVAIISFDPKVIEHPWSAIILAVAALMLSVSHVLMRRLPNANPFALQAWIAGIAVLGHSTLSLIFEVGQMATFSAAELMEWGSVLYAAIGGTIIGHGLALFLIQRYPVSTVNPYFLLTPIFAIAMGVFIWGDEPGTELWIGGALTLLGVAVITFRQKKKALVTDQAPG